MIVFFLDQQSGVPAYLQVVQQVKHAARMGMLQPGDQLPTVKEVAEQLAINPNTVLKAYRELDLQGFVETRRGLGTYLTEQVAILQLDDHTELRASLERWIRQARLAGLDDEDITALFNSVIRISQRTNTA